MTDSERYERLAQELAAAGHAEAAEQLRTGAGLLAAMDRQRAATNPWPGLIEAGLAAKYGNDDGKDAA